MEKRVGIISQPYTTAYFAPKIRNIVPIDIRNSDILSELTTKIKSWNPVTCPCPFMPYFCWSSRI